MAEVRKQVDLIAKPLFKQKGFNKKGEAYRTENDQTYTAFVYHFYQYGDPWISMLYYFGFKKLDLKIRELFEEGKCSTADYGQDMEFMIKDGLCTQTRLVCHEDTLERDVIYLHDLFFEKIYPELSRITNYEEYYQFLKTKINSILRDQRYASIIGLLVIAKSKGEQEYYNMKNYIISGLAPTNLRIKEIIDTIEQKFDGNLES